MTKAKLSATWCLFCLLVSLWREIFRIRNFFLDARQFTKCHDLWFAWLKITNSSIKCNVCLIFVWPSWKDWHTYSLWLINLRMIRFEMRLNWNFWSFSINVFFNMIGRNSWNWLGNQIRCHKLCRLPKSSIFLGRSKVFLEINFLQENFLKQVFLDYGKYLIENGNFLYGNQIKVNAFIIVMKWTWRNLKLPMHFMFNEYFFSFIHSTEPGVFDFTVQYIFFIFQRFFNSILGLRFYLACIFSMTNAHENGFGPIFRLVWLDFLTCRISHSAHWLNVCTVCQNDLLNIAAGDGFCNGIIWSIWKCRTRI